jgi:hypothetical protein
LLTDGESSVFCLANKEITMTLITTAIGC